MTQHQRVLLSSIQTLTFFDGEKTAYRRSSPVDQLTCKGYACSSYRPDVIQCYNQGGSGSDIQWKCEADLPSKLKLGRVEVGCEGWRDSDDPYILKDSCGLTYTLKSIDPSVSDQWLPSGLKPGAILFWIIFWSVALFIIYPILRSFISRLFPALDRFLPGTSSGGSGGGGGGGGGPSWWGGSNGRGPRFWGGGRPSDPPPPYTPRQTPKATPNTEGQGWRPGFWTESPWDGGFFGTRPSAFGGPRGIFTGSPFGQSQPVYRGQGSSRDMDDDLGPIRSSTGFGRTRNR
ncbi:hypothetical protein PPACK8108_LOCUS2965 [Phakopsora pachyrhizi]|uniref:Store-operated calcium entry-associated regulatory factor n=1 Tax=Phakopsora pachyrhizi TaxID=170000 RepID=A0AAV0AKS5_PHAPC|nr:hypothetical protein PPACK8108_LOCUS2965 [Phakopsora pachyrhizi]